MAIIRQLCFLSNMWVLGINSGRQVWGNMALHAAPSRASGDLAFYLFLMNNSYLINFLFCQRDSGSFFFFLFAFITDSFHDVSCWGRMNE